ncbi:ferrochelatase [Helicobacter sp. 16-1353]|nr:ferrochelatase [Helicobacter sp. 16-1353]
MGGPNNLFEVELFLKNMFNDPLILTIKSPFMRKMVANMIANSRLESAKSNYKHIGSKSPLVELTFKLTKQLQALDSTRFYTYAMRYTPPFSDSVAMELKNKNINKITLFSMYPQYSNTTTLSSVRDFLRALKELDYNPEIKIVENYPTDSGFIESCIEKIKETNKNFGDFILFLSAHSIPKRMIDLGDPYKNEIEQSAKALKEALEFQNIYFKKIIITYQSKIGPVKWLEPSTADMIKKYKDSNIMIYPLAFSIDNSETDYELEIENRHLAQNLGIKEYVVCKCPNYSTTFAKAIINLINSTKKDIKDAKI